MGLYLNPDCKQVLELIEKGEYVDKSDQIKKLNKNITWSTNNVLITRPPGFGKTLSVQLAAAYYSKALDTRASFSKLKISKDAEFESYFNKYNVIFLDIKQLDKSAREQGITDVVSYINQVVIAELRENFEGIKSDEISLANALYGIFEIAKERFVFIIDEYDYFRRAYENDNELLRYYDCFLIGLFKGSLASNYIALAYLTGVLPIKFYGNQSGLNNFSNYCMDFLSSNVEHNLFNERDITKLCLDNNMNINTIFQWYGGYNPTGSSNLCNPNAVMKAIKRKRIDYYCRKYEGNELIKRLINSDIPKVKENILKLIDGESLKVSTGLFLNDLTSITAYSA